MSRTAGGTYLRQTTDVVQAYRGLKHRQVGDESIRYVRPSGYTPNELALDVCEDSRDVSTVDSGGKAVGKGEVRVLSIQVRRLGGVWKLWSGSGKDVPSCE
jgi:hypothetical protein